MRPLQTGQPGIKGTYVPRAQVLPLDESFLAPVPTWLCGEMFTAEYPGAVQLARGHYGFTARVDLKAVAALVQRAAPAALAAVRPRVRENVRSRGNGRSQKKGGQGVGRAR
jgi:hypothetical protein